MTTGLLLPNLQALYTEIDKCWKEVEQWAREELHLVEGIRSVIWGKRLEERPQDITGSVEAVL